MDVDVLQLGEPDEIPEFSFELPVLPLRKRILHAAESLVWRIACRLSNPIVLINHRLHSQNGGDVFPTLNDAEPPHDAIAAIAILGWGLLVCLKRGERITKRFLCWGRIRFYKRSKWMRDLKYTQSN